MATLLAIVVVATGIGVVLMEFESILRGDKPPERRGRRTITIEVHVD